MTDNPVPARSAPPSVVEEAKVDEHWLAREIASVWGEHGAHADIYSHLLRVVAAATGYFVACYYANQTAFDWCLDSTYVDDNGDRDSCGTCFGCNLFHLLKPAGDADMEKARETGRAALSSEGGETT